MRVQVCAVLALVVVCGCSKRPTAPPLPAPTRFMVFASDRGRAAGSYRNWIGTMDGGGASQLPARNIANIVDRHPSITQDGRIVAYQGSLGRGGSQDVFLLNRSGGALTDDPNVNTTFDEIAPCISLDGSRLAFVRDSLGIKYVRLYDLATHLLIPLPGLAAPGFSDWQPALDQHGHRIAFTTNRGGTTDVMVYQISTATLIAPGDLASPAGDQEPAISGDGRYVVFTSNRSGGMGDFDLYLFDLNTNLLVTLPGNANSPLEDRDPSISMDGSNIVFVSNRVTGQGGYDLWNLNRIGAVLSQPAGESTSSDDLDPSVVWP